MTIRRIEDPIWRGVLKTRFLYFAAFSGFLLRIPNSSTSIPSKYERSFQTLRIVHIFAVGNRYFRFFILPIVQPMERKNYGTASLKLTDKLCSKGVKA